MTQEEFEQAHMLIEPVMMGAMRLLASIDVEAMKEYVATVKEEVSLYKATGCFTDSPNKYRNTVDSARKGLDNLEKLLAVRINLQQEGV